MKIFATLITTLFIGISEIILGQLRADTWVLIITGAANYMLVRFIFSIIERLVTNNE